jgi:hypothetical protein
MSDTTQGWIAVSERLPENDYSVLCFNGNYRHIGYYLRGEWFKSYDNKVDVANGWDVTHWMPLPTPPKQ